MPALADSATCNGERQAPRVETFNERVDAAVRETLDRAGYGPRLRAQVTSQIERCLRGEDR